VDHSASTYLGIELVKNVLEVVALDGLFGVEEVEELLHKLWRHVDFELADLHGLVNDELQEELIDALKVGPRRVHLLLLVNACLCEVQVALLDVWQRTENVLLNHLHHLVQVGDDNAHDVFLVREHLLQLLDRIESFSLHENVNGLKMVVGGRKRQLTFPFTSFCSSL